MCSNVAEEISLTLAWGLTSMFLDVSHLKDTGRMHGVKGVLLSVRPDFTDVRKRG